MIASQPIQKYFNFMRKKTHELNSLANIAKKTGIDPQLESDIPIAASVSERVEAIMGSISPNIIGKGIPKRINELETEFGFGDWRVALKLAEEISTEKFCKFDDQITAINIGIRTGFAYITQGTVSAPLEGLIDIRFKKRRDGKKYLAMYFAGPIRGGGATASAVTVVITDYIRKIHNIDKYDPSEDEIRRFYTEVTDYYDRVERKQYKPTEEEMKFIISNLSVELNGDPTSKLSVSNFKNLDRIETDRIRGGMALLLTDCIPLKGAKVLKKIKEWGSDFNLSDWNWLEEFLELKKKIHSRSDSKKDESKLKPNYAYISEIVAGRPIFTHPLRKGGFRLRYGRSRLTGHGSWAISPITMAVCKDYLAIGTQLRVERPGKSTSLTACDSIEGPILKLKDGSVVKPKTISEANEITKEISEILFLGDILISQGEFLENNHFLAPPGFCPEWWFNILKSKIDNKSEFIQKNNLTSNFFDSFLPQKIEYELLLNISKKYNIPLHPELIFYWNEISPKEVVDLTKYLYKKKELTDSIKRSIELIGAEHRTINSEIEFDEKILKTLKLNLNENLTDANVENYTNSLNLINDFSEYTIEDLWGTAIGARMGRPEKAKMRDLKGSPNFLFPVGKEGGRMNNFVDVVKKGYVYSDFPLLYCLDCNKQSLYKKCENCESFNTSQKYVDPKTKIKYDQPPKEIRVRAFEKRKYQISELYKKTISEWDDEIPQLIKGVERTLNKHRYAEHPLKGILRAKFSLRVNKDGTIRYDGTELGVTHFKPKEIGLSLKKLKKLGYESDYLGNPIVDTDQLIEIFPQDVIIPDGDQLGSESGSEVLLRTANFVDEELTRLYDQKAYYNVAIKEDLIGRMIIGLAPHTSAGIAGRIIGFSKISALLAHPYWHAAQRRDLDGEETSIMLMLDAFLNFSRDFLPDQRGSRSMDAPLVITTILNSKEVDDEVYDLNIVDSYPLEFYEYAREMKEPWDINIRTIKDTLDTVDQYENHLFTHPVSDLNEGVLVSAYKTLPTMSEKMDGQVELAKLIRAVSLPKLAELIVNGHFIRDTKGNLRKFTMQQFRCPKCNEKYRRMPLSGICNSCKNPKLIYTISEGSIKKYIEATHELMKIEGVSPYLRETIVLLQKRIDSVFGKELTKQKGLGEFI
jgi:DNA polymerase II large subunit